MHRLVLISLILVACSDGGGGGGEFGNGVAALGGGTGDISNVAVDEMADRSDGLDVPRDLAFNPEKEGELWIVNKDDDSVTLLFDAGKDNQSSEHLIDPYAVHFMDSPSSIAFGKPGHFGTCQESQNTYNGAGPPNEFMGPTLWSSDLDIFATSNAVAVDTLSDLYGFYTDLGSHLDMLHESPDCMGIAWDHDNVYWVFDGYNSSIVRYDFAKDHGVGWDDHSDGIIYKYVEGDVEREAGVPSHLALDHGTGLLYVADTGNGAIMVLDTESGEEGDKLRVAEPGTTHRSWDDADFWTLVDVDDLGLELVSGLELYDGLLFVSDNELGVIVALDLDGNEVDRLDTELDEGALMGLAVRSLDEIWMVDAERDEVLRLTPAN